jgi:hypothetical protein
MGPITFYPLYVRACKSTSSTKISELSSRRTFPCYLLPQDSFIIWAPGIFLRFFDDKQDLLTNNDIQRLGKRRWPERGSSLICTHIRLTLMFGDQMNLLKSRSKCSPTNYLSKSNTQVLHLKQPNNLYYFCNFLITAQSLQSANM